MTRVRVPAGDRAELRVARQTLRGLVRCPLCGRSGGALRGNHVACERCREDLAPTRFQLWRAALGLTVADLAAMARLTPMTVHRALRGERMGKRTATKLSRLTRLPFELFREGEPSPFVRKA